MFQQPMASVMPVNSSDWNCIALKTKRCLVSMFHVIISVITLSAIGKTKMYNKKINNKMGFA